MGSYFHGIRLGGPYVVAATLTIFLRGGGMVYWLSIPGAMFSWRSSNLQARLTRSTPKGSAGNCESVNLPLFDFDSLIRRGDVYESIEARKAGKDRQEIN